MEFSVIILAAGKGTRLKSELAKPLHQVAGRPLIDWVIDAATTAGCSHIMGVISPPPSDVSSHLEDRIELITQSEQKGTGHAVLCGIHTLAQLPPAQPVIILFADTPLITSQTISHLASLTAESSDLVVAGFETGNPSGYGRLKQTSDGLLEAIVEDADASDDEKQIALVNGGVMAAKAGLLCELLPQLTAANAQNELYLTDLVSLARTARYHCSFITTSQDELSGINDRAQLAQAEQHMQLRLRQAAMASGVTLLDPLSVYFSYDTQIAPDTLVEPHVFFGPGVTIGQHCHIKAFSHLEGSHLADRVTIGPFARLRPGTRLDDSVKIGNFVETKNSHFHAGAKASHLSYIGDADIGSEANIGAGTITCNYDGFNKFKTVIGNGAFIGSNTALVAPVSVGEGAIIGAGSTITEDISDNDLAVARAAQRSIRRGAEKLRAKKGK